MLESTSRLTYKTILHIIPNQNTPTQQTFLQTVLGHVASYLEKRFSLPIDRFQFISGQPYRMDGDGIKLQTAFLPPSNNKASLHWAATIRAREASNRRISWLNHIGIEQTGDGNITFYFAEYHVFYQAGSLRTPVAPDITPPKLIEDLLHSPAFDCVSGSCKLTDAPWPLVEEDIDEFLELLQDSKRTIPIAVVTCVNMISLKSLCSKTMGNLVICYIEDFSVFASLCMRLPPELQFPWNSIKIFLPLTSQKAFHMIIPFQEISELGREGTATALYRAFCTCLTAHERISFITTETIAESEKLRRLAEYRKVNTTLQAECIALKAERDRLHASQQQLSERLEESVAELEKYSAGTYQEQLASAECEIAVMKRDLTLLTERLCSNPREILSMDGLEQCAEILDLAAALRTFQSVLINH